jgi:hypothetical protein
MRFTNFRRAQQLLAGAATVVTFSLAVTLRIERPCAEEPPPNPRMAPSLLYSYPEILFANSAALTGRLASVSRLQVHPLESLSITHVPAGYHKHSVSPIVDRRRISWPHRHVRLHDFEHE